MPGNLMYADTMFPRLQEGEDPGTAIKRTNNYLYMLVEQLRYSFHNLELANFNNAALDSLKEIITAPIYASIGDTNGDLAELALTAKGLSSQIKDAEGSISTLSQTASSLQSQISDVSGSISTLTQTASSLQSQITAANGNISSVSQTASKINWLVKSGTSASNFTLTDRAAKLVADQIDLTGFVTFSSLSTEGETTIHGGNIKTGKISTERLHLGGEMLLYSGSTPTVTSYYGSFGAYQGWMYDANGNLQSTNGVGIRYSSARGQLNCTSGGVWCGYGSSSGISAYSSGVTIKGNTIRFEGTVSGLSVDGVSGSYVSVYGSRNVSIDSGGSVDITSDSDDVVLSSSDGTIALRMDWANDRFKFYVGRTSWYLDASGLHK